MTVSDAPQRIGLYGGTFDPPHIGHVRAARNFICAEKLDILYIMPANIPPHKQIDHADDPIRRFEMCKAAFGDIDGVVVSDYEIVRSGISYTVDTLRHLHDVSGGAVLFMLCGDDMFLTLDRWREPDEIFRMSHIVCMRRYDDGEALIRAKAREYEERFGVPIISSGKQPPDEYWFVDSEPLINFKLECGNFAHLEPDKLIAENKVETFWYPAE